MSNNGQIVKSNDDAIEVNFTLLEDEDFENANEVFSLMETYVKRYLKDKVDFGLIPGCGDKPVLFKPGAEKLVRLFKLRVMFEVIDTIVDYRENLFHYHYRCSLYRDSIMVGQCDGVANSRESKFNQNVLTCPSCGKEGTVNKDKNTNTYYCWTKKGGCGAKNIQENQIKSNSGFNYNNLNTLVKMAQKRALVGAVLIVCGASMYFTQDMEDYR